MCSIFTTSPPRYISFYILRRTRSFTNISQRFAWVLILVFTGYPKSSFLTFSYCLLWYSGSTKMPGNPYWNLTWWYPLTRVIRGEQNRVPVNTHGHDKKESLSKWSEKKWTERFLSKPYMDWIDHMIMSSGPWLIILHSSKFFYQSLANQNTLHSFSFPFHSSVNPYNSKVKGKPLFIINDSCLEITTTANAFTFQLNNQMALNVAFPCKCRVLIDH